MAEKRKSAVNKLTLCGEWRGTFKIYFMRGVLQCMSDSICVCVCAVHHGSSNTCFLTFSSSFSLYDLSLRVFGEFWLWLLAWSRTHSSHSLILLNSSYIAHIFLSLILFLVVTPQNSLISVWLRHNWTVLYFPSELTDTIYRPPHRCHFYRIVIGPIRKADE